MQQNVGHVPIGGIKIDDNASSRHEKQATISSSIETGKRNTSDGCLNGDRAMDFELGDTTSGAFGVSDHPADDKLQQKANKNDVNSYQGCSLSEDRVYNVCNVEYIGAIVASDAACNLYIPLQ
jgi:hypothetical protein